MRLTFNTPQIKALKSEVEQMTHQQRQETLEEVTWLIEGLEDRLNQLIEVRNKLLSLKHPPKHVQWERDRQSDDGWKSIF